MELSADRWTPENRYETLLSLGDRTRTALKEWLGDAREVVHIGYAKHANTGDHLILRAEQMLFESLGVKWIELPMSTRLIPEKLRDTPLIFKGGGYLGDPGAWHYSKMSRWVLRHRAPVLLMPCSAYFKEVTPERWARTMRWSDTTIFCRDVISLGILEEHFPGVAKLVPDSAFYSARVIAHRAGSDRVILARSDRETGGAKLAERYPDVKKKVEWLEKGVHPGNVMDVIAKKLDGASWIVTDRLHVHVAAKMLGLPHDFLANSYHKNEGFYRTWSAEDPLVTWVPVA
ncbi:MAG: polysaccharide pyruvyl transferase family protein [Deltaproteobacteria bacterium]|nr:polysaccharide pyruvyl transferase family protein [Deltaproteobacteria bacterium]